MNSIRLTLKNVNKVLYVLNAIRLQTGQSLIELMLAIGLIAVLLPTLVVGFTTQKNGQPQMEQRLQAMALVREGQEAARVFREKDWSGFAVDGTYHPVQSGSTWSLAANSESVNGFTRQIVISDVCRDSSGNIASCTGNTVDSSTKQVVTTVSWNSPFITSVSATDYLTRFGNTSYTETTQAQFDQGTKTNVVTTKTADGEVTLGPGITGGDWCKPQTNVVATYDLTHSGVPIAISAATQSSQDLAYTTTGDNSSGDSVDKLTISHATPPVVTNPNSNNEAKAYGIFTDGTYVYFNENNPPNHTVRIAKASDLSNVGFFDVNKTQGSSVFVLGNTGYTTGGSTLYSFDLTTIKGTSSQPQLGSVGLAGTANRVMVVGTNAYVATTSTTNQLQIIDVSNPAKMKVTKSINLGNGQPGIDLFVDSAQKYAYIITSFTSGKSDFFTVNLSSFTVYSATAHDNMNPKGIIVPSNRVVIVGSGGQMYQVYKTDDPTSPSYCGGMSPAGVTSINAVSGVTQSNGNVFSYIVTDNASAEFQIIQGGSGVSAKYATTGTFTSQTIPVPLLTHDVAFNYFSATAVTSPPTTTISYLIAIKHGTGSSLSCSGVTFSDSDFVSISPGPIPLSSTGYVNPGQCMRYRAILSTTDTNQTPILDDITFNYSP